MSEIKRTQKARRASKVLLFVLYASFAAVAYNIYSEVQELRLIDEIEAFESDDVGDDVEEYADSQDLDARIDANDDRQRSAAIGYLASLLLSLLMLAIWSRRVNSACRELGASDMRFTPGWSSAYWFLPIVNLYRPFQVVKELWTTTSENGVLSPLLSVWWAAWIFSGVIGRFAKSSMSGDSITLAEHRQADQILLVSHAVDLIAFALTIFVVTKITTQLIGFQERRTVPGVRVVSKD